MDKANIIDKATFEKAFEYYCKQEPAYILKVVKNGQSKINPENGVSNEVNVLLEKAFEQYGNLLDRLAK